MGGFTLKGPNYTFKSTNHAMCRCMGYVDVIDAELETLLLNKLEKVLNIGDLPLIHQMKMKATHAGDGLQYVAIPIQSTTPAKIPTYADILSSIGQ